MTPLLFARRRRHRECAAAALIFLDRDVSETTAMLCEIDFIVNGPGFAPQEPERGMASSGQQALRGIFFGRVLVAQHVTEDDGLALRDLGHDGGHALA